MDGLPWVLLDGLDGDALLVIHHKDLVQQIHTLPGQLLHCLLNVRNLRPQGPHLLQPVAMCRVVSSSPGTAWTLSG